MYYEFFAVDEVATYCEKPPVNAIDIDPYKCDELLSILKLSIRSRVMLQWNISVMEGLVNGSMGIIKEFQWHALRYDDTQCG